MNRPGTNFLRRIRTNADGDPARPHLIAAATAAALVGVTGPLILTGISRRAPGLPWGVQLLAIVVWALAVVAVLDRVLPWQTLVRRGLRREAQALEQIRATDVERRWFHVRWLAVSSAWAVAITALPVLLAIGIVNPLLPVPDRNTLVLAFASLLVGCLASNLPTLVTCGREAGASARTRATTGTRS